MNRGEAASRPVCVYRAEQNALVLLPVLASSLDEASRLTQQGVYTVFRLYPGQRVLHFDQHYQRLKHSADLLKMEFPLSHLWLRDAVHRAVQASRIEIPRVRLTVPASSPDSAIISLEPLRLPDPILYSHGVRVCLAEACREIPEAKDTRFIAIRQELMAERAGCYEILLTNTQGKVLEGSSSNFFAILDGRLRTAGSKILPGIARAILLEVAPTILPVELNPVEVGDLPSLQEAFITSASRGVLPVVQIDSIQIGSGTPGRYTLQLQEAFNQHVEQELDPL